MGTRNRTRKQEIKGLSLTRRTVKDLSVHRGGPKGGFIMKDSVIVRTGSR
jgi:hypothetical protein